EQLSIIGQSYSIGSRIGVGKFGSGHVAPGLSLVVRPALGDYILPCPAKYLHFTIGIGKDAGLNGIKFLTVVDRPYNLPGLAIVLAYFKVHHPIYITIFQFIFDTCG